MANIITKHIPNSITCLNLLSGCVATAMAFSGELETALLFIVIGAVFDFFDGMSARLLHVTSDIGKELDSLADDITFGVAPATMAFTFMHALSYPSWMGCCADFFPYLAFVMAAFSALRLAKFNLDERQSTSFIGLPTPANALFWGSLTVGAGDRLAQWEWSWLLIVVLIGLSCWIMVSEVPMFALKFKQWGWKGNQLRYVFLLSCLPLLALFRLSGLAIIIVWYVLLSVVVKLRGS